jgi:cullin 1
MISKLKLRCGNQFTSKMEGMLTDLQIGKDHQASFEKFYKDGNLLSFANSMDFSVQVLTTGYWPTYKLYDVVLPPAMSSCCQVQFG